jgi:hypothetical protein
MIPAVGSASSLERLCIKGEGSGPHRGSLEASRCTVTRAKAYAGQRAVDSLLGKRSLGIYQVFIYLQLLDLLTTLIGFRLGAAEASPFIRIMMHAGPVTGVIASKVMALVLGALCVYMDKLHIICWISYCACL